MATGSRISAKALRSLRQVLFATLIVAAFAAAPKAGVAQSEVREVRLLSIRPVLGWGGHVNYGMDVGVSVSSDVEILGAVQRWSREPIICAIACPGVFAEGWSLGGGLRLSLDRATARWWPIVHFEAGIHRFRYFGSSTGPRWSRFVGARGGVVTRWSGLELEVAVRAQRVSGFDYVVDARRASRRGSDSFLGLQLGVGVFIS